MRQKIRWLKTCLEILKNERRNPNYTRRERSRNSTFGYNDYSPERRTEYIRKLRYWKGSNDEIYVMCLKLNNTKIIVSKNL